MNETLMTALAIIALLLCFKFDQPLGRLALPLAIAATLWLAISWQDLLEKDIQRMEKQGISEEKMEGYLWNRTP